MAPKLLQMAPWRTLLPDAPRSRPGEPLARPGASQKIHLGGLGTPLERKVDRFRPPGGSPGGSRRGSGRSFGELFGGWAGGNEKKQTSHKKVCFFGAVFACVFLPLPCVFCSPRHSPARKHNLKSMLKTIGFYNIICVCAVCARSANILQTERKSNKKLSKCKRKTLCHESSKKSPTKHRLGSQHVSKNRPRRPPGAPWPPPARDFRAKSSPKALLEASRGGKKFQGRPWEKFPTRLAKNWHRGGIGGASVGGVGGARKSLSWRI
jgi:hypothetical protein